MAMAFARMARQRHVVGPALLAASMLGEAHPKLRDAVRQRRAAMTAKVLKDQDPRLDPPA